MSDWSQDVEEGDYDSPLMVLLVSLTGLVASLQAAFQVHAPVDLALQFLS